MSRQYFPSSRGIIVLVCRPWSIDIYAAADLAHYQVVENGNKSIEKLNKINLLWHPKSWFVYPTVVEEEKKDQIHDQNSDETNRYVSSKDIHNRQNASRILSPHRQSRQYAPHLVALGLGGGPWFLASGWSRFLFRLFFNVFFKVVRWQRYLDVRIRFSLPYPCFGMCLAPTEGVWRCASCGISWDPVGFCVRWFGFRSNYSVVTIIGDGWCIIPLWSSDNDFTSVYYNKLYYDKICLTPAKGGPRIVARLRLMLVFVVIARSSRYLFVFFLLVSRMLVLLLMIIKRSMNFFKKKRLTKIKPQA
jgi:hypothetical protein